VTSKWANSKGQLTFLKYAVLTPIEVLNFGVASSQMNTFMGELPHPNKTGPFTHHWYSTALIERLLDLAECEDFDIVRDIFEYPLEHCPELLLLKLASITVHNAALALAY
jgi:CCR4-NOT transcription complex subunit 1